MRDSLTNSPKVNVSVWAAKAAAEACRESGRGDAAAVIEHALASMPTVIEDYIENLRTGERRRMFSTDGGTTWSTRKPT